MITPLSNKESCYKANIVKQEFTESVLKKHGNEFSVHNSAVAKIFKGHFYTLI